MEPILNEYKIFHWYIYGTIIPKTPPWIIKKPKVILKLSELLSPKISPSLHLQR